MAKIRIIDGIKVKKYYQVGSEEYLGSLKMYECLYNGNKYMSDPILICHKLFFASDFIKAIKC